MRNRLISLPLLLLVTGCGSGYGSPAASTGGGTPVSVDARNTMFSPATITARPGATLTVTITNRDAFDHNFSVSELKVNQDVPRGQSRTVTFTATGTTNLQFFCEYHRAKGMVGILDLGGAGAPGGVTPAPAGTASPYGSAY